MRHGRLLAEDSPSRLLDIYNHSSLEDVFLELCIREESADNEISNDVSTVVNKAPDMYRYVIVAILLLFLCWHMLGCIL